MEKIRIIIAGGRKFNDYDLVKKSLHQLLSSDKYTIDEIVSGKASGADTLGETFAKENNITIKEFPSDWTDMSEPCVKKKRRDGTFYNALAGIKRNEDMAKYANACICFWDGKSTGTKSMISLAKKYKLKLKIVRY